MSTKKIYSELIDYIKNQYTINTHCHHLPGEEFIDYNLEKLINKSYVSWCGVSFDETRESKAHFLSKVRYRSYFVWLQKALQELYHFHEPLTVDNWSFVSDKLQAAHRDPQRHIEVLQDICKYKKVVLDAYWSPGSNNDLPSLFAPTFRINMFLYSYNSSVQDHNGNNALIMYDKNIDSLEEYVAFMKEVIIQKKKEGCVALKSALAYDRDLDFRETPKEKAQKIFKRSNHSISAEEIRDFQNYIFFEICTVASELSVPFQCHTGLGELDRTNAQQLREAIVKNPDTKFVLFHGSYPWTDDIAGLLHNYSNAYADICWLPIISQSAATRLLHELIEVGTLDKITWGCDTWSSEESFGALLALRHVLATVLSEKIASGYLNMKDACLIIDHILYKNASELYKVS